MKTKYVYEAWQEFLQEVINKFEKGCYYYVTKIIPDKSMPKIQKIDESTMRGYMVESKQKHEKYQMKKQKQAIYSYLRYKNFCIMMKTDGSDRVADWRAEKFKDIRRQSILFQVENIELKLHWNKGIVVEFSKNYFREINAKLKELVRTHPDEAIYDFNAFNVVPGYNNIITQLKQIRQAMIYSAKRVGIVIEPELFVINPKIPKYKKEAPQQSLEPTKADVCRDYLCQSWQGFVQQLIINANLGYHLYSTSELRLHHHFKWHTIDYGILERFEIGRSKDKRYHYKKAGKSNYLYLRYDRIVAVMRTEGIPLENVADKTFFDMRERNFIFQPVKGGELELRVGPAADGRFTLWMTRDFYRNTKVTIFEYLEKRQLSKAIYTFNALNGIPCYAGINSQKQAMLRDILQMAKKHGIRLKRKDFRINTRLKVYKVFDENDKIAKSP